MSRARGRGGIGSRGARIILESDDESNTDSSVSIAPVTRRARQAGGGSRGAPPPAIVSSPAAPARGRGRGRVRASRGRGAGGRGAAVAPRMHLSLNPPIFGGRQAAQARQAHNRINNRANGNRTGGFRIPPRMSNRSESDDADEEEGEDVEVSESDSEDNDDVDDSIRDFIVSDEEEEEDYGDNSNVHIRFHNDTINLTDDDLFHSEDDMDLSIARLGRIGVRGPRMGVVILGEDSEEDGESEDDEEEETMDESGLNNETFSREVEEFELMEERENQTARRAEERLRKKEDKEEKENKTAIRTEMFGACTVCAEDEVTDPVGCIYCANFIGCRKCANRWYRMSKANDNDKEASCPLCRHKWTGPIPEVGDMLDLVKTAD